MWTRKSWNKENKDPQNFTIMPANLNLRLLKVLKWESRHGQPVENCPVLMNFKEAFYLIILMSASFRLLLLF